MILNFELYTWSLNGEIPDKNLCVVMRSMEDPLFVISADFFLSGSRLGSMIYNTDNEA